MSPVAAVGAIISLLPKGVGRLFTKENAGGDAKLSLAEFESVGKKVPNNAAKKAGAPADLATLFGQIDADQDGALTKVEVKAFRAKQVADMRAQLLSFQEGG